MPSQVRPDGRASCAGLSTLSKSLCRRFRFRPQQRTLSLRRVLLSYARASRNQHVIALCHCSSAAQDKMDDLLRLSLCFGPSCLPFPIRHVRQARQDAHTDLLPMYPVTSRGNPRVPRAGEVLLRSCSISGTVQKRKETPPTDNTLLLVAHPGDQPARG